MALYMSEDICDGCEHAVFHECCQRFCHCKEKNEPYRKYITGTCLFKKIAAQNAVEAGATDKLQSDAAEQVEMGL
jgi:hypothetical protein